MTGSATIRGGTVRVQGSSLALNEAVVTFREGFGQNPSIVAQARGSAFGEPFTHHITGTLLHPMHFFVFAPPLNEQAILASFQRAPASLDRAAPITLRVAAELFDGVEVTDWAPIATPAPALATAPTPAAAPAVPAPVAPAPAPAPVPGAVR